LAVLLDEERIGFGVFVALRLEAVELRSAGAPLLVELLQLREQREHARIAAARERRPHLVRRRAQLLQVDHRTTAWECRARARGTRSSGRRECCSQSGARPYRRAAPASWRTSRPCRPHTKKWAASVAPRSRRCPPRQPCCPGS